MEVRKYLLVVVAEDAGCQNCKVFSSSRETVLWLHSQLEPERPLCLAEQKLDKQNTEGN